MKSVQSSNDPETSPRKHALGDGPWHALSIDCPVGSHVRVPPYGSTRSRKELRFPCPRNRVVPGALRPLPRLSSVAFLAPPSVHLVSDSHITRSSLSTAIPSVNPRERLVDIIDSRQRFLRGPSCIEIPAGNSTCDPMLRSRSSKGRVTASSWVPSLCSEYKPPLSPSRMEYTYGPLLLETQPFAPRTRHVLRSRPRRATPHPPPPARPRRP